MNIIFESWDQLLKGAGITALITLVAVSFGLVIGFFLAMARTSDNKFLSNFAKVYVNTFRSIPLVMILLGFYLVLPNLLKPIVGFVGDIRLAVALVAFSLFQAAYFSEIIRSGINSINKNQVLAARALGFSRSETFWNIIIPQAIKNTRPVLLTQSIILFQDTALVYVIGLADFFGTAVKIGERSGTIVTSIVFASTVYLIICVLLQRLANRLTKQTT